MGFVKTNLQNLQQTVIRDMPDKSGSRIPSTFFTPTTGKTHILRILPGWTDTGENAGLPYKKVYQHWDLPSGLRSVCPYKQTDGQERCFICEQIEALNATQDSNDARDAKRMKPGRRFIYQVIDREDPYWLPTDKIAQERTELINKPKIKLLSLGWQAHKQITDYFASPSWGDIADPYTGVDLELIRTGRGLDTTYGITMQRNSTPLFQKPDGSPDEEAIQFVAENLYDLDNHPFFKTPTYEETQRLYLGEENNFGNNEINEVKNTMEELQGNTVTTAALPAQTSSFNTNFNMDAWNQLVQSGQVILREHVKLVPQNQVPWCYAQEPNPADNECWKCPLVADCTRTYQAQNKRQYHNGPSIVENMSSTQSVVSTFGKQLPKQQSTNVNTFGKKPQMKTNFQEMEQGFIENDESDPIADMEAFLTQASRG